MALLTLTSDIGHQDYLVAAVKGQLWNINPAFSLVDISHNLTPFNYPQAAYICRNAIFHFPPHSFHLVLVNLFDRPPEQLLLAYHNEQYILCADNGLLTMILEEKPEMVIGLPLAPSADKNTLFCVQKMAEAVQQLHNGARIDQIGIPDVPYMVKNQLRPALGKDWIEAQIIHIDHFENIIVNINKADFEEHGRNRPFKIQFRRDETIDRISGCYADVPEGEKLALFNSAGYLEIAINKGNASGLLGVQGYSDQPANIQKKLFYQTVKIQFYDEE